MSDLTLMHRYFLQLLQSTDQGFFSKQEWLDWLKFPDSYQLDLPKNTELAVAGDFAALIKWAQQVKPENLPAELEKIYQQHSVKSTVISTQYQDFLTRLFIPCQSRKERLFRERKAGNEKFDSSNVWKVKFALTIKNTVYLGGVDENSVYIGLPWGEESLSNPTRIKFKEVFAEIRKKGGRKLVLNPQPGRALLVSLTQQYFAAIRSDFKPENIELPSYLTDKQKQYIREFASACFKDNTYRDSEIDLDETGLCLSLERWLGINQSYNYNNYKVISAGQKGLLGKVSEWQYHPYIKSKSEIAILNVISEQAKDYYKLLLKPETRRLLANNQADSFNLQNPIDTGSLVDLRDFINIDPGLLNHRIAATLNGITYYVSPLRYALLQPEIDDRIVDCIWRAMPTIPGEDFAEVLAYSIGKAANEGQAKNILRVKQLRAKVNISNKDFLFDFFKQNDPVTFLACLLTPPCNSLKSVKQIIDLINPMRNSDSMITREAYNRAKVINAGIETLLKLMAEGKLDCHFLSEIIGKDLKVVEKLELVEIAIKANNKKFLRELDLIEKPKEEPLLISNNNNDNASTEPVKASELTELDKYIQLCETSPTSHSRHKTASLLQHNITNDRLVALIYEDLAQHSRSKLRDHLHNMNLNIQMVWESPENRILKELAREVGELETRRIYKHGSMLDKITIANQIDVIHAALILATDPKPHHEYSLVLQQKAIEKINKVQEKLKIEGSLEAVEQWSLTNQKQLADLSFARQAWQYNKNALFHPPVIHAKGKADSLALVYGSEFKWNHSRVKTAEWLQKIVDDKNYALSQKITLLYWAYETLYQQDQKSTLAQVIAGNLVNLADLDYAKNYSRSELTIALKEKGYIEEQTTFREKLLHDIFKELHKTETSAWGYKLRSLSTVHNKIGTLHSCLEAVITGNAQLMQGARLDEFVASLGGVFQEKSKDEKHTFSVKYAGNTYKFNQWCDEVVKVPAPQKALTI